MKPHGNTWSTIWQKNAKVPKNFNLNIEKVVNLKKVL